MDGCCAILRPFKFVAEKAYEHKTTAFFSKYFFSSYFFSNFRALLCFIKMHTVFLLQHINGFRDMSNAV